MKAEIEEKLLKTVKDCYEAEAADFSATRKNLFWPEVAKLAAPVKAGDRVLDLGCGQGRLLDIFQDRAVDYLGIDQSAALIEIARANYPGKKFRTGNILDLALLPEKDFDYIFCIAVLHHVPGAEARIRVLKAMAEKLRPGGRMIISVWNLRSRPKFWKLILRFSWQKIAGKNEMDFGDILFPWGKSGAWRYYHAFTAGELKKISRAADLKIDRLYNGGSNRYLVLSRN